ncbi:uracil-DNA glycosylase [Azospirillum sp. sgz302134]
MTALDSFLTALGRRTVGPGVFRPWTDWTPGVDSGPDAPKVRRAHLKAYLGSRIDRAELVLIAEAVGYQGARFSGVPMTCERTLLGAKPGVPPDLVFAGPKRRTSAESIARNTAERAGGFCEPTATIVWTTLLGLGLAADRFVLWNSFAFHPHRSDEPLTNRTPTDQEVEEQADLLDRFLALFPGRTVVAVGETARRRLSTLTMSALGSTVPAVRHPANGGATAFREGVRRVVRG